MAVFIIKYEADAFVLIEDQDQGRSITNDAENVVKTVDAMLEGGLEGRTLYYRDTMGRFDKLQHREGRFIGFAPASNTMQIVLSQISKL